MNISKTFGVKFLFVIGIVLIAIIIFFIFSLLTSQEISDENITPNPQTSLTPEEQQIRDSFIPVGEEGMTSDNSTEYIQMREDANQAFAERKERLPFLMQLPFDGGTFKIEITPYSDTVYISTIPPESNKQLYRQQAVAWLEANGANFNNFEIEYKN